MQNSELIFGFEDMYVCSFIVVTARLATLILLGEGLLELLEQRPVALAQLSKLHGVEGSINSSVGAIFVDAQLVGHRNLLLELSSLLLKLLQFLITLTDGSEDGVLHARLEVSKIIIILLNGKHGSVDLALRSLQALHLGQRSDLRELIEHHGGEALLQLISERIVRHIVAAREYIRLAIGSLPRLVPIDVHFY